MKKFVLFFAVTLMFSYAAQAKIFAFGVKAGLELPSINTSDLKGSVEGSTGFHAGLLAQINIPIIGIGVQPELLYAYRGAKVTDESGNTSNENVSYIDVPLNITWGIDLKIVRPFVAVTPYISCALNDVKVAAQDGSSSEAIDKFNYGIGLGGGIELFQKLQFMARYNWGLNDLGSGGSVYKVNGVTLSLGYLF